MTSKHKDETTRKLLSTRSGAQIDDLQQGSEASNKEQINPLVMASFRLGIIMAAVVLVWWSGMMGYLRGIRTDYTMNTTALRVGYISGGIWATCIILVVLWKHLIQPAMSYRHLRMRARRPLIIIIVSGLITFVAGVIAFWPIYGGIRALLLFAFLAYATMCFLSFV